MAKRKRKTKSPSLSPTALSADNAASVLSKASGQSITQAMIQADLEAGAPVNSDGTLNLLHYAAWLVKNMN